MFMQPEIIITGLGFVPSVMVQDLLPSETSIIRLYATVYPLNSYQTPEKWKEPMEKKLNEVNQMKMVTKPRI